MRRTEVTDIETLCNTFILCVLDIQTLAEKAFVVHELQDDFDALIGHLSGEITQIGYNNLDFDGQVLQWIWDNRSELSSMEGDGKARAIYGYAQEIINRADGEWPDYKESDIRWRQVDLYKMWHFDNKAKATSLKWLQFSIDYPDVREMPVHHTTEINDSEVLAMVVSYCFNDIRSTYQVFRITRGKTELSEYKGKDKVEFRQNLKKQVGIECLNWNDVKIGDEMNLTNYLKETCYEETKYQIKSRVVHRTAVELKNCIPAYIEFKTPLLQELLADIKSVVVKREGAKFLEGGKKFERNLTIGKSTHNMMLGGIHSCERPRIIIPGKEEILRDADVGSQYPSAIARRKLHPAHLSVVWASLMEENILKRMSLKGAAKKDPKIAAFCEAIKLSLNGGGYGKLGEEGSWQHDFQTMFQVTIGCQLDILMLIEELELNGINIVSSNTDGIVSLFKKDKEETYNRVCKEWEEKLSVTTYGKLEFCDYEKIVQTTVNDYLAVKVGDGPIKERVKKKGDFLTDFELHNNKSKRIVTLALEAYYTQGISPKKFVREHTNIFDFCIGVKSKGDWYYEERKIEEGEYTTNHLQKIVRYFISSGGSKIVKCNTESSARSQTEAGRWLQTIFNRYEELADYKLNYDYYIQKVFDIIHKVQPGITVNYTQLSLL